MHQTGNLPADNPKQRKYPRFDLRFPVALSFPAAGVVRELKAISRNVSLGGVLVEASDQVPLRTHVTLTMNVVSSSSRRPVRLLGEGEVVRVEPLEASSGFAIAVECNQPITEMTSQPPEGI